MGNPLHLIETKNANKECSKKTREKENSSSLKHNAEDMMMIKKP
jgi:hypothetical protein